MVLCPSCGTVPDESSSEVGIWKLCACQLLRFRTSAGGQWRYGYGGLTLIQSRSERTFLYRDGTSSIEGVALEDVPDVIRLLDVASVLDS